MVTGLFVLIENTLKLFFAQCKTRRRRRCNQSATRATNARQKVERRQSLVHRQQQSPSRHRSHHHIHQPAQPATKVAAGALLHVIRCAQLQGSVSVAFADSTSRRQHHRPDRRGLGRQQQYSPSNVSRRPAARADGPEGRKVAGQ